VVGLLRVSLLLAAAALLAPLTLYLLGNGITVSGLAFAGIPVSLCLLATSRRRAAALVIAAQLLFVLWRLVVVPRDVEGWRVCDSGVCGRGPWLAYLAPEREAVLAGLELSRVTGAVEGDEYESFRQTFRAAYPPEVGLPSAMLMVSTPGSVRSLVHLPPGKARAPCILFLHGFGGLLTPYVRVMAESALGREYVLAAPALDPIGDWSSERASEVLREAIETLPPEADRGELYLVGLSNGSIYGARYAPRFRGTVLLSGVGDPSGGRALVISGTNDVRIPIDYVREFVATLPGTELRELPADHVMILSHARQWTELAAAWLRPPQPGEQSD